MKNYYNTLSKDILTIATLEQDSTSLRRELFYIRQAKLEKSLNTDDLKKAFWINIYKAFYFIISKETKGQNTILKLKRIKIARTILSLNDIEHGILRKSKYKMGFGYITNPFYSNFIKVLSVNELDYRIHFAIRSISLKNYSFDFYDYEKLEKQLTLITKDFIEYETEFDTKLKLIRTSKFLFTYLHDFGGIHSIRNLLQKNLKKDLKGYQVKFRNNENYQCM
ncbi:DUF547 domain-containing protein [Flavobacterium sp. LB2P44]|uniref:DUF547 domain-containing protein n=1 Tax=Flavobacterium sp. LB2P44 TaxID=3401713 RepID=UPI003AAE469A